MFGIWQEGSTTTYWSTQFIPERQGLDKLYWSCGRQLSKHVTSVLPGASEFEGNVELVNSIHPIKSDSSREIVNEPYSPNLLFQGMLKHYLMITKCLAYMPYMARAVLQSTYWSSQFIRWGATGPKRLLMNPIQPIS